jgi:hypothetical protein
MAIIILAYFAFFTTKTGMVRNNPLISDGVLRSFYLITALLLTGFLFFLRSATGIMIFFIVAAFFILNISLRQLNPVVKKIVLSALLVIMVSAISFIIYTWFHNFHSGRIDYSQLDRYTINGNPYLHDTVSGLLENGNYTGLYQNISEMIREWNKISSIDYNQTDLKGQPISSTLNRYLTSKGLRKDSVSIHLLTADDIKKIEAGLANWKFRTNPGISQRFYETLYEIHVFIRTGFVEHHSFGQRLAFTIESFRLIKYNPITGVGSGDVYVSMQAQVKKDRIAIDPRWEGKPHNQFAFYLIAFGITGLLWILVCWIFPVVKLGSGLLFNLFAVDIIISMFLMDTHESYSSMVFFALFYSLLIFGKTTDKLNAKSIL